MANTPLPKTPEEGVSLVEIPSLHAHQATMDLYIKPTLTTGEIAALTGRREVTIRAIAKRHGIGHKGQWATGENRERWYFTQDDVRRIREIPYNGGRTPGPQPDHWTRRAKRDRVLERRLTWPR